MLGDTQTHTQRPSTVTLAAHARRELMKAQNGAKSTRRVYDVTSIWRTLTNMAIKRMRKACVPGALSSPGSRNEGKTVESTRGPKMAGLRLINSITPTYLITNDEQRNSPVELKSTVQRHEFVIDQWKSHVHGLDLVKATLLATSILILKIAISGKKLKVIYPINN